MANEKKLGNSLLSTRDEKIATLISLNNHLTMMHGMACDEIDSYEQSLARLSLENAKLRKRLGWLSWLI